MKIKLMIFILLSGSILFSQDDMSKEEIENGIKIFSERIRRNDIEGYKGRAVFHYFNRDTINSIIDIEQYYSLYPYKDSLKHKETDLALIYLELIRGNNSPEIIKKLDFLGLLFRGNTEVLSHVAYNYMEITEYEIAINYYDDLLTIQLRDEWLHNRANCYSEKSLYRKAVIDYKLLVERNETNPVYHASLGEMYFKLEEWNLAEKELKTVLELDSCPSAEVFNNLIHIYLTLSMESKKNEIREQKENCIIGVEKL